MGNLYAALFLFVVAVLSVFASLRVAEFGQNLAVGKEALIMILAIIIIASALISGFFAALLFSISLSVVNSVLDAVAGK